MQTFLPYKSFVETAKCLDWRRLGKQRVEALQLLNALRDGGGWINHPATKMWRDHSNALIEYGVVICDEWIARGFEDTCRAKILAHKTGDAVLPSWLGDSAFHASHRSNLLRKDSKWYGQFGWTEPSDLPYVWPTKS